MWYSKSGQKHRFFFLHTRHKTHTSLSLPSQFNSIGLGHFLIDIHVGVSFDFELLRGSMLMDTGHFWHDGFVLNRGFVFMYMGVEL